MVLTDAVDAISGKYSATVTTDHYAEAWVLVRGAYMAIWNREG